MFEKLISALLPRVKADDEELVDPQTVLRVSFVIDFLSRIFRFSSPQHSSCVVLKGKGIYG